ncbi:MAG: hypothetical protein ACOYZ7_01775 [Chloroflexota bacterium]
MAQKQALFTNLVFNEQDEPAEVVFLEGEPHYIILDAGFRRHVEASHIDRQVMAAIREQILSQREFVIQGILQMLGQDDLFTKAMIDSSIEHLDERLYEQGLPEEARSWLGMLGFKVVVNHHGDVVRLDMPSQEMPADE